MAQQVKVPATKQDYPSSIPRNYIVKEKNQLPQAVSGLHTYTYTYTNKFLKNIFQSTLKQTCHSICHLLSRSSAKYADT